MARSLLAGFLVAHDVNKTLLATLGAAAGLAGAARRRFRRDLAAAYARLDSVARRSVTTRYGRIDYADAGEGAPLLAVHGIFGGADAGLLSLGDLVEGRRVLAPSRFGYLGSSLPAGATPAVQADAFAALLDELGIDRVDVVGFSAGSPSVLQLALRHPARVAHLVVVSGDWPSPAAKAPPPLAKFVMGSDAAMWAAKMLAGPALLRFVAGVPKSLPLTADDRVRAQSIVESIFPVRERAAGVAFDAFVGNPDVNDYPLEALTVPTLVVHARDDTLAPYAAAEAAAARIPGARLVNHECGGHVMLGGQTATRAAVAAFLADTAATRRPTAALA